MKVREIVSRLRSEVWSYAILLIVLFAIATLAAKAIIEFMEEYIPPSETQVATLLVWAFTLGFMLIAGAFALWAIKFSAEAESRRRIGRFVDAMNYLSDGFIAVDYRGGIRGSNPAAIRMMQASAQGHEDIRIAFPSLGDAEWALLLNAFEPHEIERDIAGDAGLKTLRFRSQPSGDLIILMISDVTAMNEQRSHSRQMARLQLVGQLARGVAHDFNDLLSGIAGHASLLGRMRAGSRDSIDSVQAITRSAEQGIALAGHLQSLSLTGMTRASTGVLPEHLRTAIAMLRDSLPTGWTIEDSIPDSLPHVSLPGIQAEQMILNLGLLAADAIGGRIGRLALRAGLPGSGPLMDARPATPGGVILLLVASPDTKTAPHEPPALRKDIRDAGVIQSVLRSMLEEAGGALDVLQGVDGSLVYRMILAGARLPSLPALPATALTEDIKAYVAGWRVLLACPKGSNRDLAQSLTAAGLQVLLKDSVISVLASVEEDRGLEGMILDRMLLGPEATGLIRAILKLHPSTAVVVLSENPQNGIQGLASDIVEIEPDVDVPRLVRALVDARSLAMQRRKASQKP